MKTHQLRFDWVDLAKGIGIFLVILGHLPIPDKVSMFIYTFHVPLFFFLSGCLVHEKYTKEKYLQLIYKIIKNYFMLSIIIIVVQIGIDKLTTIDEVIVYVNSLLGQRRFTTLWFLSTYLITKILYQFLYTKFNGNMVKIFYYVAVIFLMGGGTIILFLFL